MSIKIGEKYGTTFLAVEKNLTVQHICLIFQTSLGTFDVFFVIKLNNYHCQYWDKPLVSIISYLVAHDNNKTIY